MALLLALPTTLCAQTPAATLSAAPAVPLLTQVMQGLAAVRERRAQFVEERRIGVLEIPLHSRGTLLYHAPDHLEKHVLSPKPDDMVIDGHFLILKQGDQPPHAVDMNDKPPLQLLATCLQAPLAGDMATLQRAFILAIDGDLAHWHLRLTPYTAMARRYVRQIDITGQHDVITEIDATQANGDTDHTAIIPVQ